MRLSGVEKFQRGKVRDTRFRTGGPARVVRRNPLRDKGLQPVTNERRPDSVQICSDSHDEYSPHPSTERDLRPTLSARVSRAHDARAREALVHRCEQAANHADVSCLVSRSRHKEPRVCGVRAIREFLRANVFNLV